MQPDENEGRVGVVFGRRPAQLQCWGVSTTQGSVTRSGAEAGAKVVFEDSPSGLSSDTIWFSDLDYAIAKQFGRHIKHRLFFRSSLDVLAREVAQNESGYAIQGAMVSILASGVGRHGLWPFMQRASTFAEACYAKHLGSNGFLTGESPLQWQICASAAEAPYWAGYEAPLMPGWARFSAIPSRFRLAKLMIDYGIPDFYTEPEKISCADEDINVLIRDLAEDGKTGFVQAAVRNINPNVSRFFKGERDTFTLEEASWLARNSNFKPKRLFVTKIKEHPLAGVLKDLRPYSWFDGLYAEALSLALVNANPVLKTWVTTLGLVLLADSAEILSSHNCWVTGVNMGRLRITGSVLEQDFVARTCEGIGLLLVPEQYVLFANAPLSLNLTPN